MRTDRMNMVQTHVRKTIMSYCINKKLKKRSEVWIKKLKKVKNVQYSQSPNEKFVLNQQIFYALRI